MWTLNPLVLWHSSQPESRVMGLTIKVSLSPFLRVFWLFYRFLSTWDRPPDAGTFYWVFSLPEAIERQVSRNHCGYLGLCSPGLHPSMGQLFGFLPALFQSSLTWELTCTSLIVPCRTLPPASGNAAAPERLEALKYQRIKKPKKSSKGSSKSKKRSGKWWEAPAPLFPPFLLSWVLSFRSRIPTLGFL